MKIQVNLSENKSTMFNINWRYDKKKKTTNTYCFILNDKNEEIASGRTYVHKGDRFVKAVGRKATLKKAIDFASATYPDLFNKEVRKSLWAEYFKLIKQK